MKLSLMLLNPAFPVFMNPDFTPKSEADPAEYESLLKLAADAGYPAVDLSTMEFERFSVETVKTLLDKYGLTCGSVICFDNYTDSDPAVLLHTQAAIDATAAVGCKTLMLVAGFPDASMPREVMRENLIANLREAVQYAADRGVTVCIEDFPSTVIPMCAAADVDALLDSVPGLRLVYDSANMLAMGEDPLRYHDHFADRIGYYHLKDVIITDDPTGDAMYNGKYLLAVQTGAGLMDFPAILSRAKANGYSGYLSVEYAPRGEEWQHHLKNVMAARELLEQAM